ncbi:MAG: hypothetical protein CMC14_00960 [Flavobacteriaceae bacterium]|nr:hypothetical protein [Flavobacteriaceae bacterium]|tara:strand:- start:1645 stop:2481 length:837 start_codon:yes stop_codon:yes gene_type:complete
MKTLLKKIALLSFASVLILLTSCKKDDDSNDPDVINFSQESTTYAAKTDVIVEGSQNIAESAYVQYEEPGRMPNSYFSNCVSFTLTGGGEGSGTIVVDFGTSCQLLNGAIVSGKINMSYGPILAGVRTINYEYEDFTYNSNGVEGGGTITRDIENNDGNPQSTINEDITVSFTGTTITGTRTAQRIAEWVEGVGSGTWTDNVFHIEGNWQTDLSNGFSRTGVVTQTLVRKASCLYFVSGKITVSQEGLTGILDFGNGVCDPFATIIFEGQEFPIILGN